MADTVESVMKLMEPYVEMARPYLDMARPYLDIARPYLEIAQDQTETLRLYINKSCRGMEAWQIIMITFGVTLLLTWIYDFLFQEEETLVRRFKKSFFRTVRSLPFVQARVEREMAGTIHGLQEQFNKGLERFGYYHALPKEGMSEKQVLKELQKYKNLAKVNWGEGSCSGCVYSGEENLTRLNGKVYEMFAWTNPLHPDVFPDVRKMEAEVVRMTCTMFHGGPETCGSVTSGGTESIMLACKSYRDMAMERGIKHPEMIVPVTAHAAFDKGAQYFRMKITHIPVDTDTRKVDIRAMRRAINKNTCMLAGSAPQFPHGIIDDIVEISKLGERYGIPVHVDSCLGGFLLPFMKKAGFKLPPFDFRLPGVTSISADTHKYGFAPKGSSVIMYSDKKYRSYQYFVQPDWPGGIYGCPTFGGSRAGSIIAACWATMVYFGQNGYVDSTKKIVSTTRYLEKELKKINGIFIFGKPLVSVLGIGSSHFNIYRLSDALSAKGWNLNALQFPSSIHLCCTLLHTYDGVADRFVRDVRACVKEIMKDPKAKCGGAGAMYGMAQSIPDRSLVSEIAGVFYDAYYDTTDIKQKAINGKH